MIVRILGEGQYDVSDDSVAALNELDHVGSSRPSSPATRRRSAAPSRPCSAGCATTARTIPTTPSTSPT